jgi:hypothetical protein
MIEEKNRDLFIRLCADVDTAVNQIGWFIPIYLSGHDRDMLALKPITEFNGYHRALQYHRDAMERVTMPGHGFTRLELQTADECISTAQ